MSNLSADFFYLLQLETGFLADSFLIKKNLSQGIAWSCSVVNSNAKTSAGFLKTFLIFSQREPLCIGTVNRDGGRPDLGPHREIYGQACAQLLLPESASPAAHSCHPAGQTAWEHRPRPQAQSAAAASEPAPSPGGTRAARALPDQTLVCHAAVP